MVGREGLCPRPGNGDKQVVTCPLGLGEWTLLLLRELKGSLMELGQITFRHSEFSMWSFVPDGPFDGFFTFPIGPQAYLEVFSLSGGHGLQ